MIQAVSAVSHLQNAFKAGKEAAESAILKLNCSPDILWVYGSIKYDQKELLKGINSVISGTQVIGCTTDGEISSSGISEDSVVILALKSSTIEFQTVSIEKISQDSFQAGVEFGNSILSKSIKYIQVFADGITSNGAELIRGIQSILGEKVTIVGGIAGDSGRFKQTFQYHNDRVLTDSIVGVAFDGDFVLGTGAYSGWTLIGDAKKVTKSSGNIIYELDGQPALSVYQKFLGRHAELLPAIGVEFPIGLVESDEANSNDASLLYRAIMDVNWDKGSISLAGDVPSGSWIKMTIGNKFDIIQAAKRAGAEAAEKINVTLQLTKPAIAFVYSCMTRKACLGSRIEEEILAIKDVLGDDIPIIGFYSYGGFAPFGRKKISKLHYITIALSLISES